MKLKIVAVVALIFTCALAGCSSKKETTSSSPSPTAQPKPAAVLDGTYRLDFDRTQQTMDGKPSPEDPYARTYAFKSTCSGDGNACVAVGIRLNDQDPKQTAPGGAIVLDYLNGEWVRTYNNTQTCRGVQVPVLESWSFKPGDGGAPAVGTRRLAFTMAPCTGAFEQPLTATRTGDVDPAVQLPDPAKVAALKHSAGEGLRGRYKRTITPAAPPAQPTTGEVTVATGCIRNADHCLTYITAEGANGAPATVEGYGLMDGLWSLDRPFDGKCPDQAPVNGVTHTEFLEPADAADPIAKLTGTQRDLADPCPGTTNADITLERIGD
ncbi:MAG TPA: hypothetical protein VH166_02685 [Mycobacterium sp.]|jgi:hypothetical protein|nr:hypothetical protein [Mycobacterium sp.]